MRPAGARSSSRHTDTARARSGTGGRTGTGRGHAPSLSHARCGASATRRETVWKLAHGHGEAAGQDKGGSREADELLLLIVSQDGMSTQQATTNRMEQEGGAIEAGAGAGRENWNYYYLVEAYS